MKVTKLTEEQMLRATAIVNVVAAEHQTTADKLRAKAHYAELKEVRRTLYAKLRADMRLTYAMIGEACNRSSDAIEEAFNKRADKRPRKTPKPKVEVIPPLMSQPPSPVPEPVAVVSKSKRNGNANNGDYKRLVTTWLSKEDDMRLRKLLAKHRVSQEEMVRGIIVDALHDEETMGAV